MLGKIAEKRREAPTTVLDHYFTSGRYLYESNATYPFKISFTNPQNLSLEALEIYYRITASIVKYVETHRVVPRGIGKHFLKVLKETASSPFALSQAKINGMYISIECWQRSPALLLKYLISFLLYTENSINAFKRKLSLANEEAAKAKMAKLEQAQAASTATNGEATVDPKPTEEIETIKLDDSDIMIVEDPVTPKKDEPTTVSEEPAPEAAIDETKVASPISTADKAVPSIIENKNLDNVLEDEKPSSPFRRGSQESTATTTTQTTTTTGSSSTSSSSSDSSTTDSSSSETDDSSSDDGDKVI